MSDDEQNFSDKVIYPLIFLGIFVLLIAISAEVDWFWNGGLYGTVAFKELAFVWLFSVLLPLILIIGWLIMERFPQRVKEPTPIEGDKKKFIWWIIILLIIQNTVPVFYIVFDRDLLYVDLVIAVLLIINFIAFAAIAAFFPIHSENAKRRKRWLIFFLIGVLPFYVLVGGLIGASWATTGGTQETLKLIYWIMMWGMVMPLSFVFLGVSWKNGRGESRKAFNIAFAGILMQYSFLEDFLFYALNGQPQPPLGYTALLNFPLDIARLFGHQTVALTTVELLIWMIIMISIAVVIIFDIPYIVYKKITKKN
ncbi:MAG: hypothetical protein HWN66_07345 [Candidatus Helarchaeota archaeon]|nr:hypothetical protein [Candidatus Helarchaeota archaeon]